MVFFFFKFLESVFFLRWIHTLTDERRSHEHTFSIYIYVYLSFILYYIELSHCSYGSYIALLVILPFCYFKLIVLFVFLFFFIAGISLILFFFLFVFVFLLPRPHYTFPESTPLSHIYEIHSHFHFTWWVCLRLSNNDVEIIWMLIVNCKFCSCVC